MGTNTKIEWATHTFNPWTGCAKVSPGCAHCYAEGWAKRSGLVIWGQDGTRKVTSDSNWKQPLKWRKEAEQTGVRARVFCASLADVFEDRDELIEPRQRLVDLIHETADHLDWLLLTKRPENITWMMTAETTKLCWMGTTTENQEYADKRIPHLLKVPAAIRFISYEPALGTLDLFYPETIYPNGPPMCCSGIDCGCIGQPTEPPVLYGINWVIAGGESGPGARPMHPDWARSIRNQCKAAGVAFLFKQWGEWLPCTLGKSNNCPADGRCRRFNNSGLDITGDMSQWKDPDLRARKVGKKKAGRLLDGVEHNEFPEVRNAK